MAKRTRSKIEKEVDAELEAKTKEELLAEFDQSQALHVPARKRESKLISIRLPMNLLNRLRDIAIRKGDIGYQQLIKTYLAESLEREEMHNKLTPLGGMPESPRIQMLIWHSSESPVRWRTTAYHSEIEQSSDTSHNRAFELRGRV